MAATCPDHTRRASGGTTDEWEQERMGPPRQEYPQRAGCDHLRGKEDGPALSRPDVVVRRHPHDLSRSDDERVAGGDRPHLVVDPERADAALEVRQHEEVVRVRVLIRPIAD